ncbi:MAG: tagatose 1,6-diphosphate aldolase [Anaerolineales bacterium]
MTTHGKFRHLTQSSTPDGHFVILAIDHRANLKALLDAAAPHPLTDTQFADFKAAVLRHLMPFTSAVLIDPAFGIARGLAEGTISGHHGLLAPLEVTDYDVHPSQRELDWIEGWGVEQIKKVGGTGVKLLLPFHPGAGNRAQKEEAVQRIVQACQVFDLPFFLEPIVYAPDPNTKLSSDEKRAAVVETAHIFSRVGVDVLKLEFPIDPHTETDEAVWMDAAAELNAVCTVPWALLSAGVDFPTFSRQAQIACEAGASGVIVGRAVWAEAVKSQGAARESFLAETATTRMAELATICAQSAQPWQRRVSAPATTFDWYRA